jgi:2-amino-4-hydroxy-6-hydroxymethyldihydropteridine diphosphokinase
MSLIIATGSNQGDPIQNLNQAKKILCDQLELIAQSRIYLSAAVDYLAQPDFYNQVLEFSLPSMGPDEVMTWLLEVEISMGRVRDISKGPRMIDLDIIFWAEELHHTNLVQIPHPRWSERSFIVRPVQELPFFKTIEKCFTIPKSFKVEAYPI